MSKNLYDIHTYLNERGGIEVDVSPSEESYVCMEVRSEGEGLARRSDAYNYFNPVNDIYMKGVPRSHLDEATSILKKEWRKRIQILQNHINDIDVEVKKYLEEHE